MTYQQAKLAVAAASKNSISVAADELKIAQSNASQSIKKLEEELGFQIFKREGNGVTPTEEGYLFLEHAERMLRESAAIHSITTRDKIGRLRVGISNYTLPVDAFVRFCIETKNIAVADYACVNISPEEGFIKLKEHVLDLIMSFITKRTLYLSEEACRENHLKMTKLADIPVVVRVSKNHPLYLDGSLNGSLTGFQKLSKYPYVEFCNTQKLMSTYLGTEAPVPFGCSYKIMIEERETRSRIIGRTYAYAIGAPLPKDRLKSFGLVEIPIPNEDVSLMAVIRNGEESDKDISHYLELINERLDEVINCD